MEPLTPLDTLLQLKRPVILDGGFATALEDAGFSLKTALWSAAVLASHPAAVQHVHVSFAAAGADIVESGSYQLSSEGCKHEGITDWAGLATESVRLARNAGCLVAGSLGPLGAAFHDGSEYTGSYGLPSSGLPVIPITHELVPGRQTGESIHAFHEPRARALSAAGADVLAFETIPCVLEVQSIAQLVVGMGARAWISFSARDGSHLVSGETIADALAAIDAADPACAHIVAVGVNCCPPQIVERCVQTMAAILRRKFAAAETDGPISTAGERLEGAAARADPCGLCRRIIVYPNRGEVWDAATGTWNAPALVPSASAGAADSSSSELKSVTGSAAGPSTAPSLDYGVAAGTDTAAPSAGSASTDEAWLDMAVRWRAAGAWAIGGCCRVPPALIAALRARLLSAEGGASAE